MLQQQVSFVPYNYVNWVLINTIFQHLHCVHNSAFYHKIRVVLKWVLGGGSALRVRQVDFFGRAWGNSVWNSYWVVQHVTVHRSALVFLFSVCLGFILLHQLGSVDTPHPSMCWGTWSLCGGECGVSRHVECVRCCRSRSVSRRCSQPDTWLLPRTPFIQCKNKRVVLPLGRGWGRANHTSQMAAAFLQEVAQNGTVSGWQENLHRTTQNKLLSLIPSWFFLSL